MKALLLAAAMLAFSLPGSAADDLRVAASFISPNAQFCESLASYPETIRNAEESERKLLARNAPQDQVDLVRQIKNDAVESYARFTKYEAAMVTVTLSSTKSIPVSRFVANFHGKELLLARVSSPGIPAAEVKDGKLVIPVMGTRSAGIMFTNAALCPYVTTRPTSREVLLRAIDRAVTELFRQ